MFWTKYTIHINTNSKILEQDTVLKGNQTISIIALPIRRGYTFKGCFMNFDFIESFDLGKMVKKYYDTRQMAKIFLKCFYGRFKSLFSSFYGITNISNGI